MLDTNVTTTENTADAAPAAPNPLQEAENFLGELSQGRIEARLIAGFGRAVLSLLSVVDGMNNRIGELEKTVAALSPSTAAAIAPEEAATTGFLGAVEKVVENITGIHPPAAQA